MLELKWKVKHKIQFAIWCKLIAAKKIVTPEIAISLEEVFGVPAEQFLTLQKNLDLVWVDIEDATRPQMLWSLSNRRQQMVGDAVHLKIDETVWNSHHPQEDPIQLVMDFTDDVEERLHSPGFGANDAAA